MVNGAVQALYVDSCVLCVAAFMVPPLFYRFGGFLISRDLLNSGNLFTVRIRFC